MGKTKDVRAAVEAELGFDPLVNSADIKVMNLGGDVTLAGRVPSYPQYLEAAAAARRVDGVSGVHNNLMVVLPDSDYRDDVQLITAANNALAQNVTVRDGVEAVHQEAADLLCGPPPVGVRGHAEDVHVPGAGLDHEEAVQALQGHRAVHMEEVGPRAASRLARAGNSAR